MAMDADRFIGLVADAVGDDELFDVLSELPNDYDTVTAVAGRERTRR